MDLPVMDSGSSQHNARGLTLGLNILDYLRKQRRHISLTEISEFLRLGKPSTLRLLRTLENLGYLSRDTQKNYQLAAGAYVTGMQGNLGALSAAGSKYCLDLRSKCGETTTLACLFSDCIRVVDVYESPQHIKMTNYVGRILQPFASSLGKAIAAYQADTLRQTLLDVCGVYPLTKHTLVDGAAILKDFALVRQRGFAEDKEETVEGGYCVGAPIYSPTGDVFAAISVSSPKFRVTPQLMKKFPSMVKEAAAAISAELKAKRHS
ncbi:MAG: IclR family transcriptional regulator [Acidobacteria bacterium]|nr:MAG: IclR family transcriptional regulator [Acidobacteriota bacterium]